MKNISYIKSILLLLAAFLILIFIIASVYLTFQNKNNQPVNSSEVYTVELSDIISDSYDQSYYTLTYKKNGISKEIYRWKAYGEFGIGGGPNCNGVLYSPSKNYFMICKTSAIGLEHWGIPLVFDKNGAKVVDFSNIKNFPFETITANNGDIILWVDRLKTIKWIDDNTISLEIPKANSIDSETQIWTYKIGDDKITR